MLSQFSQWRRAIGVGVGATLYYFFSKRPENPDSEGSTSGNWSCEEPQSLIITQASDKLDYTRISEHTTTDTSIWLTDNDKNYSRKKNKRKSRNRHSSESDSSTSTMDSSYEDVNEFCDDEFDWDEFFRKYQPLTTEECLVTDTENSEESEDSSEEEEEDSNSSESNTEADSEIDWGWSTSPDFLNFINRRTSPRLRNMTPRDRRRSLEECVICFDVMLKDQPLMQLPCTHNFHVACIGLWLREQQTCPLCRKAAE